MREALGDARTKKTVTKMDISGLPKTDTYDINIEKLDEQYGEDGWEIAAWHKKTLVRRPLATHYVEKIHTPVSSGTGTPAASVHSQCPVSC